MVQLRALFTSACEDELTLQAMRLAQMDVLTAYLDWRGLVRDRRKGDTVPAAVKELRFLYELEAAQREGATVRRRRHLSLVDSVSDEGEPGDD